jgi:hypothetical protein
MKTIFNSRINMLVVYVRNLVVRVDRNRRRNSLSNKNVGGILCKQKDI